MFQNISSIPASLGFVLYYQKKKKRNDKIVKDIQLLQLLKLSKYSQRFHLVRMHKAITARSIHQPAQFVTSAFGLQCELCDKQAVVCLAVNCWLQDIHCCANTVCLLPCLWICNSRALSLIIIRFKQQEKLYNCLISLSFAISRPLSLFQPSLPRTLALLACALHKIFIKTMYVPSAPLI